MHDNMFVFPFKCLEQVGSLVLIVVVEFFVLAVHQDYVLCRSAEASAFKFLGVFLIFILLFPCRSHLSTRWSAESQNYKGNERYSK